MRARPAFALGYPLALGALVSPKSTSIWASVGSTTMRPVPSSIEKVTPPVSRASSRELSFSTSLAIAT
jgi:hypothetical protein